MGGARYADIRILDNHTESIRVKNGVVESLNSSESIGFGIRVLVDGAWGFSSSHDLNPKEIDLGLEEKKREALPEIGP